jgi:ComF family protein
LPLNNFEKTADYLCGKCIKHLPPYAGARAFGHYTAELSRLVQELKFHGRRTLVGLLAPLLAATFFEFWARNDFDLIIPVPLHSKRKRDRGYNQSELLARALAARIAISFSGKTLVRSRSTLPQVGLSDSQRFENVRKAFCCVDPAQVKDKRVLLIDDVMTTGATVSSAAQTLLDAGCFRVSVLTVARATL